jgi:polyferredoxin
MFFCGWICPFGTLHQFVGFLGRRKRPNSEKIRLNQYNNLQNIKYWILTFLLTISALELAIGFVRLPATHSLIFGALALGVLALMIYYAVGHARLSLKKAGLCTFIVFGVYKRGRCRYH